MDITELELRSLPLQLQQIPAPPEKLWMRGSLPPFETKFLTVVGSRALTHYGREACEYLISGLAGYPISIVSGLALGADACEALGFEPTEVAIERCFDLSPSEKLVYGLLAEPLPRDDLIRLANLAPHETLSILGTLELKGVLKEQFGSWQRARP
jgi:predicted Rossmann fold nucleotide-binding protein DprA/Smf involved in DNA uptake